MARSSSFLKDKHKIPALLFVAGAALFSFLLLTSTFNFQDGVFGGLFGKKKSSAASVYTVTVTSPPHLSKVYKGVKHALIATIEHYPFPIKMIFNIWDSKGAHKEQIISDCTYGVPVGCQAPWNTTNYSTGTYRISASAWDGYGVQIGSNYNSNNVISIVDQKGYVVNKPVITCSANISPVTFSATTTTNFSSYDLYRTFIYPDNSTSSEEEVYRGIPVAGYLDQGAIFQLNIGNRVKYRAVVRTPDGKTTTLLSSISDQIQKCP